MGLSLFEQRRIAVRYARALLEQADEQNNAASIADEVAQLAGLGASSQEFTTLCESPLISQEEKKKGIALVADAVDASDDMKVFLGLLADNNRLALLPAIHVALQDALREQRGEVDVTITSARKLSAKSVKELQKALEKALGQSVNPALDVDEELIGGVTIRVGSRELDASVKGMLARAGSRLYDNIQQT